MEDDIECSIMMKAFLDSSHRFKVTCTCMWCGHRSLAIATILPGQRSQTATYCLFAFWLIVCHDSTDLPLPLYEPWRLFSMSCIFSTIPSLCYASSVALHVG